MLNPIVAMIHNTGTDRWHPIMFKESPLPGPHYPDKPIRHKSLGHHTEGFDTRELAIDHIREDVVPSLQKAGPCPVMLSLDEDIEWDGEGTPLASRCFPESSLKSPQQAF